MKGYLSCKINASVYRITFIVYHVKDSDVYFKKTKKNKQTKLEDLKCIWPYTIICSLSSENIKCF